MLRLDYLSCQSSSWHSSELTPFQIIRWPAMDHSHQTTCSQLSYIEGGFSRTDKRSFAKTGLSEKFLLGILCTSKIMVLKVFSAGHDLSCTKTTHSPESFWALKFLR